MRILNDRDKAKVCKKSLDHVVPLSFNGLTCGSSPGAVTKEPALGGRKACLSCREKDEEALTRSRERKEAAQWREAACTPVARGGAGVQPGGVGTSWGEDGCDLTVFLLSIHHSVTWQPLVFISHRLYSALLPANLQVLQGPKVQPVLFVLSWCQGSRLGGHL